MNNANAEISEEKRQKNFETLKRFFKTDMQIKEELLRKAPLREDDYNEDSRIDYTEILYGTLKDFKDSMRIISDGFEFGDEVTEAIEGFFKKTRKNLSFGKYESGVNEKAYQRSFTNMRPEFIEEVKERCKGYTCASPERLADLIGKATTVNEALHVMHSYIMNNEEILKSMPKLEQKKNNINEPITLYGERTDISGEIFDKFPLELDAGVTDIISMEDKVFMMIRDRGHALTIDMDTTKPEEIDLKYFVPKICNDEMVMALKGLDKSTMNDIGARGSFSVKREELVQELFGFIEKVPTDADMPRPNWDEIDAQIRAMYGIKPQSKEENTSFENVYENGQFVEQEEFGTEEEMIDQDEEPIFSCHDVEEMSTKKERKISGMKKIITKIINPIKDRLQGKNDRNKDDGNIR